MSATLPLEGLGEIVTEGFAECELRDEKKIE
jgi:hypothetical protein